MFICNMLLLACIIMQNVLEAISGQLSSTHVDCHVQSIVAENYIKIILLAAVTVAKLIYILRTYCQTLVLKGYTGSSPVA